MAAGMGGQFKPATAVEQVAPAGSRRKREW